MNDINVNLSKKKTENHFLGGMTWIEVTYNRKSIILVHISMLYNDARVYLVLPIFLI